MRTLIFISLISLTRPLAAMPDVETDAVVVRGVEFMYNLDFVQADSRFDSVIAQRPHHPQGYFFKGGSMFYQIISGHRAGLPEQNFVSWNDRALEVADEYERVTNHAVEADFYRGAIYGNLGRYYAVNGEWTKAFYYTRKAKNLHEDVIEKDSAYFDAYLGPGVYYYYAAQLPRAVDMLASLLGLSGDRARGISMLEKAYRGGRLGQLEAQFMLAGVYIEEGRYEDAAALYENLCRRFPKNPYLSNQLGLAKYLLDAFDDSETLFGSALKTTSGYPRAEMFAAYYLGRILKLHKRFGEAESMFRTAVSKAQGQVLFRSIDGWVPAAAWYHAGESAELDGRRDNAVSHFERSRDEPYATRAIIQAAKNRLKYPISPFEMRVVRARHDVILHWPADSMAALLPEALADRSLRKYLAQIRFYLGQAAMHQNKYAAASGYFQEAMDSPDNDLPWLIPHACYYLAMAEYRLGHKIVATVSLQKALEKDDYQEEWRIRYLSKQLLKQLE